MAYTIERATEGNIDTPFTVFPTGIDTFPRMSDVSITTLPLVLQYNSYYQSGDLGAANQLIEDNPELAYSLFTAKGQNEIRDAVIAIEYYLLNQVEELFNSVAQHAIGIEDNPEEEQMSIVAYSAEKINKLVQKLKDIIEKNYQSNKNAIQKHVDSLCNVDNTADKDKYVKRAKTADTFTEPVKLQVNLKLSESVDFDGSKDTNLGVLGILDIAHGGTGSSTPNGAMNNLGINDINDGINARTQTKDTVFNSDGSIMETLADGRVKTTVFNSDGSITETLADGDKILWIGVTTFNPDGSIKEEIFNG